MAISENELPPFLKRNAGADDLTRRELEWSLLEVLAGKHDGILGLRLIEVGGDNDVVHLLITPDCQRKVLGEALDLPELKNVKRNKAGDEPGHFIPVLASLMEGTAWWREQISPRIRRDYLKKRREHIHGDMTRSLSPEELAEIAAIKGETPLPAPARPNDGTIGGITPGNREMKDVVMRGSGRGTST